MILAVCGGKGGVGKTTVSLNLGAALGGIVIDADLTMADLHRPDRGPDLHDVLADRADPIEAVREIEGVRVLPCGRSLAGARAADPAALATAVERVERVYGDVVIDSPAGLRADAGLPLFVADGCVPVTTPTRAALTDALRTRALAREFDAGIVRVVVNRAPADRDVSGVERAFGAPAVVVPAAAVVEETRAAGRPVAADAPESPAAERFARLARAVRRASA